MRATAVKPKMQATHHPNPTVACMDRHTYWTLSGLYALFFGVLGIWLPYWPLYLTGIGLTIPQVGILNAASQGIKVLGPPLWGYLADRGKRKQVLVLVSLLTWLTYGLYFTGEGFTYLLLVTLLYSICQAGPLSLVETIVLDTLRHQQGDYGRIRLWGSLGFIFFSLLLGMATDHWGLSVAMISMGVLWFWMVVLALIVPDRQESHPHPGRVRGWFRQVGVRWFLAASFLIQVSHGAYYGFLSIHLEQQGYSKTMIGLLWALGVLAEVLVMARSSEILNRMSLSWVLTASIAVAFFRWLLYAVTAWLPLLLVGQVLHAFTFGSFHVAAVRRVHDTAPPGARATAQSWYGAISFGLGGSLGLLLSGYLYHQQGSAAMFATMAVAAGLAWLASMRAGRHLI